MSNPSIFKPTPGFLLNPPSLSKNITDLPTMIQPNIQYIKNDTSSIQTMDTRDDNGYMYLFDDKAELNDYEHNESHKLILHKIFPNKLKPKKVQGYQIKESNMKLYHTLTSIYPIVDEDINYTPDSALQGYDHMEKILCL
ncbi:hypothetical protein E3P77_02254 [Wallemia ichthyophaga]|nr:hypothetical protein E3P77_02254 [Wallemia ichthyophaga]